MRKKNILAFHRVIAPYRIDFFNSLGAKYDLKVVMFWRNLKDQTFDYKKIEDRLLFEYSYCVKDELGTLFWLKSIWELLSNSNQDIVYVGEYGLSTIIAILHRFITRSKYKIVTIVDDSYNMISENNHFTKKHRYAVNILTPLLDEVQVVEPRVEHWYKAKFNKGICFPIIADEIYSRQILKRVLPISERYVKEYMLEGKRVLLFVGRLVSLKNIEFAINAFNKANVPNSVFVIVGSGELEFRLKEIVSPFDNILLVGRFEGDELYAWYNVAHVFTLPSLQEPFGAVTNEALSAGCFSLISSAAGSNCLIKSGVNGFIIDPFDESTYIRNLISLLESSKPLALPMTVKENLMQVTFRDYMSKIYNRLDLL